MNPIKKLHLLVADGQIRCGASVKRSPGTTDLADVTCRRCKRWATMDAQIESIAAKYGGASVVADESHLLPSADDAGGTGRCAALSGPGDNPIRCWHPARHEGPHDFTPRSDQPWYFACGVKRPNSHPPAGCSFPANHPGAHSWAVEVVADKPVHQPRGLVAPCDFCGLPVLVVGKFTDPVALTAHAADCTWAAKFRTTISVENPAARAAAAEIASVWSKTYQGDWIVPRTMALGWLYADGKVEISTGAMFEPVVVPGLTPPDAERCEHRGIGGHRCELPDGHDAPHLLTYALRWK